MALAGVEPNFLRKVGEETHSSKTHARAFLDRPSGGSWNLDIIVSVLKVLLVWRGNMWSSPSIYAAASV